MAEVSYPFDGGSGSLITEQQWSNMSALWQDNGVVAVGPSSMSLKVTTLNQVGIVYVETGEANLLGFHYENGSQLAVGVPPNTTSLTRIDLVVLKLDKDTNTVRVAYKTGTAASSPVPPSLVTAGGVYEIPLAQIQLGPSATQVPNTEPQLVDKRSFVGKRIRTMEDVSSLPEGAIGYKPSNGKFYGKNSTVATELGAPPDLSAYATTAALTSHLHTGIYSPVAHTHSGGGGVTPKVGVKTNNSAAQSITALGVTPVRIAFSTTETNIGGFDMSPANAIQCVAGETYAVTGTISALPSVKTALRVSIWWPGGTASEAETGDDTMPTISQGFSIASVFTAATSNPCYMEIRADSGTPNLSLTGHRLTLHRIA